MTPTGQRAIQLRMHITNESLIPAVQLAPIARHLRALFPSHRTTSVLLTESDPQAPNAAFMTGDAFPNGGWERGHNERHHVIVYVPTLARPYPVRQQNPAPGCPIVDLRDWQEELVLVLAHELRHTSQYESARATGQDVATVVRDELGAYEAAAERAGWSAVLSWRQRGEQRAA